MLHYTRLGRNVYAIGGSKQSALLMGLPVARTTLLVYTISGFCAALGGVLLSFYTLSGFGSLAIGMELDAIAAVVIGGTLLVGGSGYLAGSVLGVLVLGLIQTLISFDGTLSSWWTKIFIATLLLAFILLQRLVFARGKMGGLSRGAATWPTVPGRSLLPPRHQRRNISLTRRPSRARRVGPPPALPAASPTGDFMNEHAEQWTGSRTRVRALALTAVGGVAALAGPPSAVRR